MNSISKKSILDAVIKLMNRVGPKLNANDEWYILGSCAALLQGVSIEPRDIELTTRYLNTSLKFQEALSEFIDIPLHKVSRAGGAAQAYYGQFDLSGIKVEIMAESYVKGKANWYNESYGDNRWNYVRWIELSGHRIPVCPLEFIIVTNAYRGRCSRVKAIGEALMKTGFDINLMQKILKHNHVRGVKREWIKQALGV